MNRLDANETRYFARQLELIQEEVYKQEYPELKARTLIPLDITGGNAILSKTYRQTKAYGRAGIVNNYATDFKAVGQSGEEVTQGIKTIGDSYNFSIQDIRAAAYMKQNLSSDLAIIAKDAIMREENFLAFMGDAKYKLEGFLNNSAVTKVQVANDGTGSSRAWASKTPTQIVRDITELIQKISTDSLDIERADTLLLPTNQFVKLAMTKMGDYTDTTLLSWMATQLSVVGIKNIDYLLELETAGVGSTPNVPVATFMLYTRNPKKVRLSIPSDFYQYPMQQEHQMFYVDCEERFGGVQFIAPKSAIMGYGI